MMDKFMRSLAEEILRTVGAGRRLVAIDGVDGSGKTAFATNLVSKIRDRPVVLIHADHFLNPSVVRHARGRDSPEGFWEDSYNYEALRQQVLKPLGPQGDGRYSIASYDAKSDRSIPAQPLHAPANALTVVEGMFLHRKELRPFWDSSIFLDVPFAETAARMAVRNGSNPDPEHPTMLRYVGGQRLYFTAARPWEHAAFIVENSDFSAPKMIDPHLVSALQ